MNAFTAHENAVVEHVAADILLRIQSDDPAVALPALKADFAAPKYFQDEILYITGATEADID